MGATHKAAGAMVRPSVGAIQKRLFAIAVGAGAILLSAAAGAGAQSAAPPFDNAQGVPSDSRGTGTVKFVGSATSPISASVLIPANRASMWISGTTPPIIKADAPAGSRERYGDTETQATGVLKNIEAQLAAQGLSMKDVVYVRAFLVPDPATGNRIDTAGWNGAYTKVFGTATNPTKTARSTVGVVQLVSPDFLIELEAFAVFPAGR
jgi:enamine deaminase RidA (YjgF/YER057c/UK114 family)